MPGADLLVLKTWLIHARGEECICCIHEQESIRMLLKHKPKLSFIPFVHTKPALPTWNRGGLLQKHTSAAPEWTNPLLAWQELAKSPGQHGLLAAEGVVSDTMGAHWRTRKRALNQGADTKLSFIQHWGVPSAEISDTWSHHKFPIPDKKEMCADV